MGLVIALACLAAPAGHQVIGHRVHLKILRAVLRRHGPEVPLTEHERRHHRRTPAARSAANLLWLTYLLAVAVIAVAFR
jgi:hypothetical protein